MNKYPNLPKAKEQKPERSKNDKFDALMSVLNAANSAADALVHAQQFEPALKKYQSNLAMIQSESFKPFKGRMSTNYRTANAAGYYNIGLCHSFLESWEEAETHLKEALRLQEDYPEAELALARTLNGANKPEEALQHYRKLLNNPAHKVQARQELTALQYKLGFKCFRENKFHDALSHFNAVIKHTNLLEDKILSLFAVGDIYGNKKFAKRDIKQAVDYFEQGLAFYKQHEISLADRIDKSAVAMVIHQCAIMLDQAEEGVSANPTRVLELLHWSGSLGCAAAWHDLGFKYEHGEDVTSNIGTAIDCYTNARKLGHASSQFNLGRIFLHNPEKRNVTEGLKCLTEAEAQDYSPAISELGHYYFDFDPVSLPTSATQNSIIMGGVLVVTPLAKKEEKASSSDETKKNNSLALEKFKRAATLGHSGSMFNAGFMFHKGIGTEPDLVQAESYYRDAAKGGEQLAFHNLFSILQDRLRELLPTLEIPDELVRLPVAKLASQFPEFYTLINDAIDCFKKAKPEDYRAEEFSSALPFPQIIQTILRKKLPLGFVRGVVDPGAHLGKFERAILKELEILEAKSVEPAEIVDAIKRVGDFTEQSLDKRKFHQSQLLNLRLLLKKGSRVLDEGQLDDYAVVKTIVGASKFQLTATVPEYLECMVLFYKKALTLKLDLSDQVAVLYAAIRLDPSLSIFQHQLPELIARILNRKWDALPCDNNHKRIFANLAYGLAHIGNGGFSCWEKENFNAFIASLLKQCTQVMAETSKQTKSGEDEKRSEVSIGKEDLMYLQQVYLAFDYFKKAYPTLVVKDSFLRDLESLVGQKPMETRTSHSQHVFFVYLKKYFPDAEEEKVIRTLPVDCTFQVSEELSFGLEYHGPKHWLHGDEGTEPVETLKSRLHATVLHTSLPNIVYVPYFNVPLEPSETEIHEFLVPELTKFGVTLTEQLETAGSKKDKKRERAHERPPHGSFWKTAEQKSTQTVTTQAVVVKVSTSDVVNPLNSVPAPGAN